MHVTLRQMRNTLQDAGIARPLSARDQETRAQILRAGEALLLQHGRLRLSTRRVADAMAMSPRRVQRLVADVDALLAALLREHLERILTAVRAIPEAAQDARRNRCLAYLQATRTQAGPTSRHLLWLRDYAVLPGDEQDRLAPLQTELAACLGGGAELLDLLDLPWVTAAHLPGLLSLTSAGAQARAAAAAPAASPASPASRVARHPAPHPAPQGLPGIPGFGAAKPPLGALTGALTGALAGALAGTTLAPPPAVPRHHGARP